MRARIRVRLAREVAGGGGEGQEEQVDVLAHRLVADAHVARSARQEARQPFTPAGPSVLTPGRSS